MGMTSKKAVIGCMAFFFSAMGVMTSHASDSSNCGKIEIQSKAKDKKKDRVETDYEHYKEVRASLIRDGWTIESIEKKGDKVVIEVSRPS